MDFENSKTPFCSHPAPFPKTLRRTVETGLPDPSNSLAHHTRTISFLEPDSAALVDPDVIGWIRSFHHVEDLFLYFVEQDDHQVSLVLLHGFSSALRSLSLVYSTIPFPKVPNFIPPPLLEDLTLSGATHSNDTAGWTSPSTSPGFTGTLWIRGAIPSITRWLYSLPADLHFREINASPYDDDIPSIMDLVSKCSNNLESLTVYSFSFGVFIIAPSIVWRLIAVGERRKAAFAQPLNGHETQRCSIRLWGLSSVDQHDN